MPLPVRKAARRCALALAAVALVPAATSPTASSTSRDFRSPSSTPTTSRRPTSSTSSKSLVPAPSSQRRSASTRRTRLFVQRFTLKIAIDESNLHLAKRRDRPAAREGRPGCLGSADRGRGAAGADRSDVSVPSVEDGESRLTFFFDGDQEYLLNCQSTPDQRATVEEACDHRARDSDSRLALRRASGPSRARRLSASIVPSPSGSTSGRQLAAAVGAGDQLVARFFSAGMKPDFMPK